MSDLFFFLTKTLELVAQTERTRQGSLKTTMTLMLYLITYLKALKRHSLPGQFVRQQKKDFQNNDSSQKGNRPLRYL